MRRFLVERNARMDTENADNANDSPDTKDIEHRNAGNKIDPAPFEEGRFGGSAGEADEEISEEDKTDPEIDAVEESVGLRRQMKYGLHE